MNKKEILESLANFNISEINEETEKEIQKLFDEYKNKALTALDENIKKRYLEILGELNILKDDVQSYLNKELHQHNKALDIINTADAKKKVNDIKVVGNPDLWILIAKASSNEQGWMKSTKAMFVGNGCLVQVSTQQRNPDGSNSIAEAITFVPDVKIQKLGDSYHLIPIDKTFNNFLKNSKRN